MKEQKWKNKKKEIKIEKNKARNLRAFIGRGSLFYIFKLTEIILKLY